MQAVHAQNKARNTHNGSKKFREYSTEYVMPSNAAITGKKAKRRGRCRGRRRKNKSRTDQAMPLSPNTTKGAPIQSIKKKSIPKWFQIDSKEQSTELRRTMLINRYCQDILALTSNKDINMNSTPILQTVAMYYQPISAQSEKAIASANWFAEVVNEYQNARKCPFVEDESERINLLDYIYVRGGALRDCVLSRDINDIDLVVDVQGLTKEYDVHLECYHAQHNQQSITCNCYLWQRYLKMYQHDPKTHRLDDIDEETDMIKKFEKNMTRCDFLLSARLFKDIIMNSRFNAKRRGSRAISALNTWGYTNWNIHIDRTMMYRGHDLKGCKFDLGDEMSNIHGIHQQYRNNIMYSKQLCLKNNLWNHLFDYLWQLKTTYGNATRPAPIYGDVRRNYQIYVSKVSKRNKRNSQAMKIVLPWYTFNMPYSTQFCDFTINGLRAPLSCLYDPNTRYIDYNWALRVKQYSNLNNGQNMEFKAHNKLAMEYLEKKRICQPDLDKLSLAMVYEDYFWRFIKVITKFDKYIYHHIWTIDQQTMNTIIKAQREHFKALDEQKMTEFLSRLVKWNIDDGQFERIVTSRLMAFKMIGIEKDIRDKFMESAVLLQISASKLDCMQRQKLYKILKNFKYKI